jgi:hypothetical protein
MAVMQAIAALKLKAAKIIATIRHPTEGLHVSEMQTTIK